MGVEGQEMLPLMVDVWQQTLNWQPNEAQQAQLQRLYELILEGNRQFNLTRITAPDEFWEKHLWDSLRGVILKDEGGRQKDEGGRQKDEGGRQKDEGIAMQDNEEPSSSLIPHPSSFIPHPSAFQFSVIDIGTGAGFPGIPVAIAYPTWMITLLDSTRKKTVFLDALLDALEIKNARTLTGRAEEVGQQSQHRERYDLALIRAVASASVCAEYALPLLKVGGLAVLYRGQWTAEEAEALPAAVETLGGTVERVEQFTTPLSNSLRHCIYLKKTMPTPSMFPRIAGIPTQKPL